jgi:hypothetical protein
MVQILLSITSVVLQGFRRVGYESRYTKLYGEQWSELALSGAKGRLTTEPDDYQGTRIVLQKM